MSAGDSPNLDACVDYAEQCQLSVASRARRELADLKRAIDVLKIVAEWTVPNPSTRCNSLVYGFQEAEELRAQGQLLTAFNVAATYLDEGV